MYEKTISFLLFFFLCFSFSRVFKLFSPYQKIGLTHCPARSKSSFAYHSVLNCIRTTEPQITIIPRGSNSYKSANFQFILYKPITPRAYILVKNVAEVQASIRCAREHNYELSIKSGGHDSEKYSYGGSNALVLDLKNLNSVRVFAENRTAEIESGAILSHVYYKLYHNGGFAVPAGYCPTVGVGGHTLGGGNGYSSRKYGLMCDNVLSFEVVDVNGQVIVADSVNNSDLYWALRGGGHGSFGVVTKFVFKLFDASKPVTVVKKEYFGTFAKAFRQYQNWIFSYESIRSAAPRLNFDCKKRISTVTVVIDPDSEEEKKDILEKVDKVFKDSNSSYVEEMSFIQMHVVVGDVESVKTPEDLRDIELNNMTQIYLRQNDRFGYRKLNEKEINLFDHEIAKINSGSVGFSTYGGAINDLQENETAFVHRKKVVYNLIIEIHNPALLKVFKEVIKNTERFFSKEAYQNTPDESLEKPLEKYYGNNLERLKEVKKAYDPLNYFCFKMSIPI